MKSKVQSSLLSIVIASYLNQKDNAVDYLKVRGKAVVTVGLTLSLCDINITISILFVIYCEYITVGIHFAAITPPMRGGDSQ